MTELEKLHKKFWKLQPLWDAFEELGWRVRDYECPKHEPYQKTDEIEIEIETWSPAGEDLVEYFSLGEERKDILTQIKELYVNYDWEEHVEPLIEQRGGHGIPSSIKLLAEDAQDIGEMYKELYRTASKVLGKS